MGLLRLGIALVILAAVGWAVARNWTAVSADLGKVSGWALVVALLLAVVGPVLTMFGWRVLMADLGSPLHVAPAGGIFFIGQLGKYLPGSVWSVLAQAEMGTKLHIPRRRSAVVGLLGIGLSVLTGLLVGLPAVPLLLRTGGSGGALWLLLGLPLLAVLCWPPLLNRLLALGLRLLRREPLDHDLSGKAILRTVVLFVLAWVAFGLHVWVLARSVGGPAATGRDVAVASLVGYALAASLGMMAVVAPAGVGVRDGLLAVMLGVSLPSSAATATVLLSRFVITFADVLVAGAGWAYARSQRLVSAHPGEQVEAGPASVTE